MKIPDIPYAVDKWRTNHPGAEMIDGQVFTQPWPAGPADKRRDQVIYYQYKADRARRTLRGIDEQVAKAEKAVAGKVPVKRNGSSRSPARTKSVKGALEAKARALAGLEGYVTNIANPMPEVVIGAYHRLWHIEKSVRMSKHDLRARPIYHHKRVSIEAHLSVVFAALAVTRCSSTAPAGQSNASCAPAAATAPSKSAPDDSSSPPKTHYRTISATPSRSSPD